MEIKRPRPAHYSQRFMGIAGHAPPGQERPSVLCEGSVYISAGTTAEAIRFLGASPLSCLHLCYCVSTAQGESAWVSPETVDKRPAQNVDSAIL